MRYFAIIILSIFYSPVISQELQKLHYCEFPEAAIFPGGYNSLHRFIVEKFVQPDAVPDSSFAKKGRIKFVIEKNGMAGKFEILERLGYGCDEEIIRILKLVKWKTAVFKGEPTDETNVLPYTIEFERSCDSNLDISQLSASSCPLQKPWGKYE